MAALSGGGKLQAKLREIAKNAGKAATLRVGFMEGATYPDGTSVPLVAAIQEFGAPAKGIPPRPFFRTMVAAEKAGWGKAVGVLLKDHDYDATVALAGMGMIIKEQLQASIMALTSPPLAPSTIASRLRGTRNADPVTSVKPLIDSGHMLASVDYEVES